MVSLTPGVLGCSIFSPLIINNLLGDWINSRGTKLHQDDPISYLFITIAEVISERGTGVTRAKSGDDGRALCSISSRMR